MHIKFPKKVDNTLRYLKLKLLPKTLFFRTMLLIFIPLIVVQVVSIFVFFDSNWWRVGRNLSNNLVSNMDFTMELINRHPKQIEEIRTLSEQNFGLKVDYYSNTEKKQEITKATRGNKLITGFLEDMLKERFPDAKQDADHAHQEHHQDKRHLQEVVQILIRLHVDLLCLRIHGKAFRQQQIEEEEEEEDQERAALLLQVPAATSVDFFIIYIINVIEQTQHACQAENGNTEEEIPDVRDSLQPVPRRRPLGDDRHREVREMLFIDHKLRPGEERGHRRTEQQRAGDPINNKEYLIGTLTQQISLLRLVFVRDGLQDEAKQDQRPYPIGAPETRGVEKREGGEERAAEGHEGGEGQFPFAARRVEEHFPLPLVAAEGEDQRLPALHEKEEHQERAQQGDDKPPVVLQ